MSASFLALAETNDKLINSSHIDTAQFYGNEKEVGEAVRQSGLKRSDVFITTKVLSASGSVDKTYESVLDSVKKIDGENGLVDLFLIHTARGGKAARKEMWLALEKLHGAGKARSIGVSNWGTGHIEEMKEYAKIWPPHVNQIEVCICCFIGFTVIDKDLASSLVSATRNR